MPWEQQPKVELAEAMIVSFERLTDSQLPAAGEDPQKPLSSAARLYEASFALLCHDGADDPKFIYANLRAQSLWQMGWSQLVGMPSRRSAEVTQREDRSAMLEKAARDGYFAGYSGIRIASDGSRFRIKNAVIWNVSSLDGTYLGQAAMIPEWEHLAAI